MESRDRFDRLLREREGRFNWFFAGVLIVMATVTGVCSWAVVQLVKHFTG